MITELLSEEVIWPIDYKKPRKAYVSKETLHEPEKDMEVSLQIHEILMNCY